MAKNEAYTRLVVQAKGKRKCALELLRCAETTEMEVSTKTSCAGKTEMGVCSNTSFARKTETDVCIRTCCARKMECVLELAAQG